MTHSLVLNACWGATSWQLGGVKLKQSVRATECAYIARGERGGGVTVILWVERISWSIRLWVSDVDSLWVGTRWHCRLLNNTHKYTHTHRETNINTPKQWNIKEWKQVKRSNKQQNKNHVANNQSKETHLCQRRCCIRSQQHGSSQQTASVRSVMNGWKALQSTS